MQIPNLLQLWRLSMVLLLDINIILDYLLKREEFYYNAKRIIEKCSDENING